ncbi:MAG: arsenate reductase ArsC [Acidobacteriota bacterium]
MGAAASRRITGVRVLFVCTGNSCRSQMAEALARHLGCGQLEALSAGTQPDRIDPLTLEVLREEGVCIEGLRPKSLEEVGARQYDWVITLCGRAQQSCPALSGRLGRLHWPIEDPAQARGSGEERRRAFQSARNAIRSRLEHWLNTGGLDRNR